MVITKCLDVYSSEFFIGMFGFNPDMDEEQLKNKIAEVKKLEEQKAQEQINEVNDYGDFTNGSKLF